MWWSVVHVKKNCGRCGAGLLYPAISGAIISPNFQKYFAGSVLFELHQATHGGLPVIETMSRQRRAPQLPHSLQQELGIDPNKIRGKTGISKRKNDRKAHRVEKRQHWRGGHRANGNAERRREQESEEEDDSEDNESQSRRVRRHEFKAASPSPEPVPQRILPAKKVASAGAVQPPQSDSESEGFDESDEDGEDDERLYRGPSPEIVLDAGSRSYKDQQAAEDAEVAALEKRLGIRGKKKNSDEDGLGDILGDLDEDEGTSVRKRKLEETEWLKNKRRKAELERHAEEEEESQSDVGGDMDLDEDEDEQEDEFSGFDTEDDEPSEEAPVRRMRENPYVAPVSAAAAKYVPPSLRKPESQPDEALLRLRRQLQGHLNKLSEEKLLSIVSEIEYIYRTNPRGDVTSTLIDLLLSLFTSPSTMSNTFVILHAAFASAIYRLIGVDFGAQLLSTLVDRFFQYHQSTTTASMTPKEPLNLVSFLANLFTFSLVASPIITSIISRLLDPLTEVNAELLLRIIRDCGPQLRSDDPSALKTIVVRTLAAVNKLKAEGQSLTVRTQFMVETITDLRNNKLRESTANAGASREHITRMRKALGSLSKRDVRASDPLRIDLSDILNSDRKGKWWLVGASWKGHDSNGATPSNQDHRELVPSPPPQAASEEVTVATLAQRLQLPTPLQQAILSTINSSPSAPIAHERILKLNLKAAQISEIPRVVLRCCAAEPSFNEFYAQLANRLCVLGDKAGKIRKSWEFACWGLLRSIGAGSGEDEEDEQEFDGDDDESGLTGLMAVSNTARLLAGLVFAGHVSLGVLRTVDLHLLKEETKAQLWVEVLLVRILVLCRGDEGKLRAVFSRLETFRQVVPRLRVFIKTFKIKRSELADGKDEKAWVKSGAIVALGLLEELSRGGAD